MHTLHEIGSDAMGPDRARIRFYGDLQHLVRRGNRPARGGSGSAASLVVDYAVGRRASIKDVIESLGPPHTEVGRIVVDGVEADFGHPLLPGPERCAPLVDVYPVPEPFDVTRPSLLRPDPLPRPAFAVDVNVGRLARRLRLLGLDAAYDPSLDAAHIAALAAESRRAVLTGDAALLKRNAVTHGRLVRSVHPDDQLLEILGFFGLRGPFDLFSRCLDCNGLLRPVPKDDILHRLEPLTRQYFDSFSICPACSRIYWRGSHHRRMIQALERLGLAH